MQTFLPYEHFYYCATTLDRPRRLGKQRVEAVQILSAIDNPDNRWHNHVAVRMWKGYEDCLRLYTNYIIMEWEAAGYKNNMELFEVPDFVVMPKWLFDERLVLSHRCNLMRKYSDYYSQFNWKNIDIEAPYWWPVPLKTASKQEEMIKYWGE